MLTERAVVLVLNAVIFTVFVETLSGIFYLCVGLVSFRKSGLTVALQLGDIDPVIHRESLRFTAEVLQTHMQSGLPCPPESAADRI